jgi:transposase
LVGYLIAGLIFLITAPLWSQDLGDLLWKDAAYAGGFIVIAILTTVAGLLRFTFIAYKRSVFVLAFNAFIGFLRLPVVALLAGPGSAFGILTGHGLATLVGILLVGLLSFPKCTGWRRPPLTLDVWKLLTLEDRTKHPSVGAIPGTLAPAAHRRSPGREQRGRQPVAEPDQVPRPQALRHCKPPGRQPKLVHQQRLQLLELLAQGPLAFGFRGDVWTQARVAEVIRRHFRVQYPPSQVGRILKQYGWSRQKSSQRAQQRDEDGIRRWKDERWPALKKRPGTKAGPSSWWTKQVATCCP